MDEELDTSADDSLSQTVCVLCRQRKTKCDRKLPTCGHCRKAKASCVYIVQRQQRGLRAGYVSQLEQRVLVLERQMQEVQGRTLNERFSVEPLVQQSQVQDERPLQQSQAQPAETADTLSRLESTGTYQELSESDRNAARADLATFSRQFLLTLAESWLRQNSAWLPIIEEAKLLQDVEALPETTSWIPSVVLRAVVALEISYSSTAISLSYRGRSRLWQYLRAEVMAEAARETDVDSLRALSIISYLDYGTDHIPAAREVISLCGQIARRLGLFDSLTDAIQRSRTNKLGFPGNSDQLRDDPEAALAWCLVSWNSVNDQVYSSPISEYAFNMRISNMPALTDSLCVHLHLTAVGQTAIHATPSVARRQPAFLDTMQHSLQAYVDRAPLSTYTVTPAGTVSFDINTIFTRLLANTTIIALHQFSALPAHTQRCAAAYAAIVALAQSTSDIDVEISSPGVAPCFATAARYHLAVQRAAARPRHKSFDLLVHAVKMCARRWPLARRWVLVLRAAMAEADGAAGAVGLPAPFWDLNVGLDEVSEEVRVWAVEYVRRSGIASVNGVYA